MSGMVTFRLLRYVILVCFDLCVVYVIGVCVNVCGVVCFLHLGVVFCCCDVVGVLSYL